MISTKVVSFCVFKKRFAFVSQNRYKLHTFPEESYLFKKKFKNYLKNTLCTFILEVVVNDRDLVWHLFYATLTCKGNSA